MPAIAANSARKNRRRVGRAAACLNPNRRSKPVAIPHSSTSQPVTRPTVKSWACCGVTIGIAFLLSALAGKPHGLAVMALGRLGTWEFDLLSDADLLFVRDEALPPEVAAKSAGQIVQVLAAYTREGTLFPVDARLRPRGSEGDLVVTAAQLHRYCAQEAEPWEALTYTKLRQIAGSAEVGKQAIAAREQLGKRYGREAGFTEAVRDMRRRLETVENGELNFKTAPGAVYDIDFLLGYLSIRHAVAAHGNLRQRLAQMKHIIPAADFAVLDSSAELMRTVEHVVRLVVGKARKTLPGTEHARRMSERIVARILRQEFAGGLERELVRTFAAVREIYDRMVR
jgi:[glutamine synthetase] adenylyltransferase / [glutamine synthetase]-adenylyl-L-tyrosine phosphorylase